MRYTSLGGRLLRVPTFDLEYLRNLVIFPEVTFITEPGESNGSAQSSSEKGEGEGWMDR